MRRLLVGAWAVAAVLLGTGCISKSEAKPVVTEHHCETDPFDGSERAVGEVRNEGKEGELFVYVKVELLGGESKEAQTGAMTLKTGESTRYLLKVAVPPEAEIVGCETGALPG